MDIKSQIKEYLIKVSSSGSALPYLVAGAVPLAAGTGGVLGAERGAPYGTGVVSAVGGTAGAIPGVTLGAAGGGLAGLLGGHAVDKLTGLKGAARLGGYTGLLAGGTAGTLTGARAGADIMSSPFRNIEESGPYTGAAKEAIKQRLAEGY